MHVCIPGKLDNFVDCVIHYINEHNPNLVLIHSTCKVGYTRKIEKQVDCRVVHCPVDGRHPDMEQDIRRYGMCIAGTNLSLPVACSYLHRFGIQPIPLTNTNSTELCKIASTERLRILQEFDNSIMQRLIDMDCSETDFPLYLDRINRVNPIFGRIHWWMGDLDLPISRKHCLSENKELI